MARQQFVIPQIGNRFIVVDGTVISSAYGLFAHNGGSYVGWVVSDIKSGLMVELHFKTLGACRDYVNTLSEEMLEKIRKARSSEPYARLCDTIKDKAEEFGVVNKYYESFANEYDHMLVESIQVDFANEVAKLIDKYPERFSNIDAENLGKPKKIWIDYLDGCTDITFDIGEGEDNPIADLTGNSTDILSLDEYKDLMEIVFDHKIDKWLKKHNLDHKDICVLNYDPDLDAVYVEFEIPNIHKVNEGFTGALMEDLIMGWTTKDADKLFDLYKKEEDSEKKGYLRQALQLCLFQLYMGNEVSDEWRHGRWKEISDALKAEKE